MKYLYSIIVLLVFPLLLSFAQENNPETPEPFTRADNECYEGGTMEGRCNQDNDGDGIVSQAEIDWAWSCGWYMARYNDGSFGRGDIPVWCASLLPALSVVSISNIGNTAVCTIIFSIRRLCLIGNYLAVDYTSDGVIDDEYYAFKDLMVGQGVGTICPAGTTFISDTTDFIPEYYIFLKSNGFADTNDWCS